MNRKSQKKGRKQKKENTHPHAKLKKKSESYLLQDGNTSISHSNSRPCSVCKLNHLIMNLHFIEQNRIQSEKTKKIIKYVNQI
jgi:hypothetical protein